MGSTVHHPSFTGRAVLAAVCAALLLLGGATSAAMAESPSASPGGVAEPVFRVGFSMDVGNMNPFVDYSAVSWETFLLTYNFLTWYDENNQPVPELATEWQVSDDETVWTFTIRDDVMWHDGVPLTAGDIAFTYNLILDNEIWFYMSYLQDVTKVEAPDDTTLVITSRQPNPMMLALYVPIVPEHLWSTIPGPKVESVEDPPLVGSGPFVIDDVQQGKFVEMSANADYFGGRPKIDSLLFQIYTSEDAMVQDYKAGALDLGIFLAPTSLRAVADVSGTETLASPTVGFTMLGINCWTAPESKGNPLLQDVDIRRAIARAIDKERIVETAMSGAATAGTSVLSPAMGDWHWAPPADQTVAYDPEAAEAILDEAGYIDRDGDGIREDADGKALDFTLNALSDYPNDISAAKMIVPNLEAVGIKVRLEIMAEAAFSDRLYGNEGVDLYVWAWGGDLDPGYQLSAFITDQILWNNDSCYSNPEYDALYVEQSTTIDRAQRVDVVQRMEQILYDESPYVLLWYDTNLQAYRADRWTGWQLAPSDAPCVAMNYMRDTYLNVQPATAAETSSGGIGTWLVIAIAAAVAVVVVLVIWALRRRGPGTEVEG